MNLFGENSDRFFELSPSIRQVKRLFQEFDRINVHRPAQDARPEVIHEYNTAFVRIHSVLNETRIKAFDRFSRDAESFLAVAGATGGFELSHFWPWLSSLVLQRLPEFLGYHPTPAQKIRLGIRGLDGNYTEAYQAQLLEHASTPAEFILAAESVYQGLVKWDVLDRNLALHVSKHLERFKSFGPSFEEILRVKRALLRHGAPSSVITEQVIDLMNLALKSVSTIREFVALTDPGVAKSSLSQDVRQAIENFTLKRWDRLESLRPTLEDLRKVEAHVLDRSSALAGQFLRVGATLATDRAAFLKVFHAGEKDLPHGFWDAVPALVYEKAPRAAELGISEEELKALKGGWSKGLSRCVRSALRSLAFQ